MGILSLPGFAKLSQLEFRTAWFLALGLPFAWSRAILQRPTPLVLLTNSLSRGSRGTMHLNSCSAVLVPRSGLIPSPRASRIERCFRACVCVCWMSAVLKVVGGLTKIGHSKQELTPKGGKDFLIANHCIVGQI